MSASWENTWHLDDPEKTSNSTNSKFYTTGQPVSLGAESPPLGILREYPGI